MLSVDPFERLVAFAGRDAAFEVGSFTVTGTSEKVLSLDFSTRPSKYVVIVSLIISVCPFLCCFVRRFSDLDCTPFLEEFAFFLPVGVDTFVRRVLFFTVDVCFGDFVGVVVLVDVVRWGPEAVYTIFVFRDLFVPSLFMVLSHDVSLAIFCAKLLGPSDFFEDLGVVDEKFFVFSKSLL